MSGDDSKWTNKTGYLEKLGYDYPNWKKRFFVLEENALSYFSSEEDWKKKKKPKGFFHVDFLSRNRIKALETGTTLVNTNGLKAKNSDVTLKKPYLIQIGDCLWNETGLRTFYVSCSTEQQRQEWLQALVHNCQVYMDSPKGKQDEEKIPEDGDRRRAYVLLMTEKKNAEEKRDKEDKDAERQAKTQALKNEPWYHIHSLCSKASVEQVEDAVAKGAEIKLMNPNGGSTLLQAATYGNIPVMKYLIQQKLDIDSQSKGGNTALHAAACMGFYDAAKVLLEMGANRNLTNKEGKTAAQVGKTQEIQDLINNWGQSSS